MNQVASATPEAQSASSFIENLRATNDPALCRILENIENLGLTNNLLELELQGYTVLPGILSPECVERTKTAILQRVEKQTGNKVDPATATAKDFNGMQYQHYLLFDDPVFPEILLEPKPLAIITYLLGESCVLSSMGSHFRGPGGLPLPVHADGQLDGFMTQASAVANCNYALTPYSPEEGAIVLFPGSHRKQRQPTPAENWRAGTENIMEIMMKQLPPEELDAIEWEIPTGGVTVEANPGDAVIWHGNSWHGGWRRELPGTRINLAAYFCRPFMSTQELRGDPRYPEVFERYKDDPLFAKLLGEKVFNGWRDEGPDLLGKRATNPRGLYD
ncbi:MAG: phytanoyl-CoA dioxygenase family protein [Pseudomonadota bacterium]